MHSIRTLIASAVLAATGLAHADSSTYALDPSHTFVTFEAKHFGTSTFRGRFDKKKGSVTLDKAAKTGSVKVTIDPASVSTGVGALDNDLKSKDFFNAAEFPAVEFAASKFSFDGSKVKTVEGTLTLLGKTLPITLNATNFNCYESPLLKREVCGGDFETTLQRSQWGMGYLAPTTVADNIRLLIQVEAIKQ
ncbi:MAG TPA: YceI family protein [Rhizobacter sp.]|nr:YceI family protein [Rhizobacter sp.]